MSTTASGAPAEPVAETSAPGLSPEQLQEVFALLPGSDSVELKVSVPDASRRSVVEALGMDVMRAQIRQVAFFDTRDLALNRHGVVVRARRIQGRDGDSVVKLRPVVPSQLSGDLRRAKGFGVELDAMPGGFVCSARMKAAAKDADLHRVFRGEEPVRKVFTKRQWALLEESAPEGLALDALEVLGPVNILKLKFEPEGYPRPMVAELWFYPDGSRILELSAKCLPGEAFTAAAESKAFIGAHGVDLGAPQQTKTRTALTFFTGDQPG